LSTFELSHFLDEISADSPCGENLEYDPLFQEMMREAEGTAEKQMGSATIAAKEPDWRKVRDLALQLLERTRDIQVSALLTCALTHIQGLSGLDEGLTVTQGLLERFWDPVFPRQDPDDDYPMLRMNTLVTLNDQAGYQIKQIPLTQSRGFGQFCWRDIEIAKGKLPPHEDDADPPTTPVIEAAFEDSIKADPEAFEKNLVSAKHALAQVQAMEALTKEKAGVDGAPKLSTLSDLLVDISETMDKHLQRHGQKASSGTSETSEHNAITGIDLEIDKSGMGGPINTRSDVIRTLDSICDYFDRHEPSSPVPFLLRRAKKLVDKNFIEILQDLAPEGINQAESICGNKENDSV